MIIFQSRLQINQVIHYFEHNQHHLIRAGYFSVDSESKAKDFLIGELLCSNKLRFNTEKNVIVSANSVYDN